MFQSKGMVKNLSASLPASETTWSDEYKQENRGTHLEWLPLLYETTTECTGGLLYTSVARSKEFLWQAEQLWMGKDGTVGPW